MPEGLKIQVGADVRQANKALDTFVGKAGSGFKIISIGAEKTGLSFTNLAQKVAFFGGGVHRHLTPAITAFNKLPAAVNQVPPALNKLTTGSNQATGAMINLGRVVQDAPFGFLGIANNLNPLLESFQRLKQSTGTTGGALKALGSSLTGAGGIGLAISLLSTGLILFGDKLFGAGQKAVEFSQDLYDIARAGESAKQSLDSVAGSLDNLQRFADLTVDVNFGGDFERSALKASIASVRLDEELFNVVKRTEEVGVAFRKSTDILFKGLSRKGLSAVGLFPSVVDVPESVIEQLNKKDQSAIKATQAIYKDYRELQDQESKIRNDRDFARASIRLNIEETKRKQLKESLEKQKTDNADAAAAYEKYVSETISEAKRLSDAFKRTIDLKLETSVFDTKDDTFKKALSFLTDFKTQKFKVIVDPELELSQEELKNQNELLARELAQLDFDFKGIRTKPILIEPHFAIHTGFIKEQIEPMFKNLEELIGETRPIAVPLKLNLSAEAIENNKAVAAAKKLGEDVASTFNQAIAQIGTEGLASIGESIGIALSGGDIGSAFKAFASSLGSALQAMGKQIIGIGVAALLAKEALTKLFANPAIAIAAGVALVAAGAALKNALSGGVKGFAQGGLVYGPQLALIGEGRGTSRSNPEVVAPLDQLRGMLQGMGGGAVYIINRRVRGRDQVLQASREHRSQRRTTGR